MDGEREFSLIEGSGDAHTQIAFFGEAMNRESLKSEHLRSLFLLGLLIAPMLVACAKPTVPVSIHGVNYTGDTFSYVVVDQKDSNNRGGGELIEPFAAGGAVCCFDLPKKWRPGIMIEVQSTHWLPRLPDHSLPEVKAKRTLQVPQYSNGKAGELWVIREMDGAISVVSTDFQPDHPSWPGKVKGWPIPSLAFQRTQWDIRIAVEQANLRADQHLLRELSEDPDGRAERAWEVLKQHLPYDLKGFTSPRDPNFRKKLKIDGEVRIQESNQQLKELIDTRP